MFVLAYHTIHVIVYCIYFWFKKLIENPSKTMPEPFQNKPRTTSLKQQDDTLDSDGEQSTLDSASSNRAHLPHLKRGWHVAAHAHSHTLTHTPAHRPHGFHIDASAPLNGQPQRLTQPPP